MELWRQVVGLGVVFGLLGVLAWRARAAIRPNRLKGKSFIALWRAAGGGLPAMRQAERLRLTPQHSLHLVVIEDRRLVVGCSTGGMTLLSELGSGQTGCGSSTGIRAAGSVIPEEIVS